MTSQISYEDTMLLLEKILENNMIISMLTPEEYKLGLRLYYEEYISGPTKTFFKNVFFKKKTTAHGVCIYEKKGNLKKQDLIDGIKTILQYTEDNITTCDDMFCMTAIVRFVLKLNDPKYNPEEPDDSLFNGELFLKKLKARYKPRLEEKSKVGNVFRKNNGNKDSDEEYKKAKKLEKFFLKLKEDLEKSDSNDDNEKAKILKKDLGKSNNSEKAKIVKSFRRIFEKLSSKKITYEGICELFEEILHNKVTMLYILSNEYPMNFYESCEREVLLPLKEHLRDNFFEFNKNGDSCIRKDLSKQDLIDGIENFLTYIENNEDTQPKIFVITALMRVFLESINDKKTLDHSSFSKALLLQNLKNRRMKTEEFFNSIKPDLSLKELDNSSAQSV